MKQYNNLTIKFVVLTAFSIAIFLIYPTSAIGKTIPVPYTSQAPYGYWGQPWQDTCEEASIIMVDAFYNDKKLNKKTVKADLLDILKKKNKAFGYSLDEDASKITKMINKFYNWRAKVVKKPTLEMLKAEIDEGRPVIVPLYGKALKNKYFLNGGPYYHVLVISGYDDAKKEFITEEPGLNTKGLDFRYKYDTIMNAVHDLGSRRSLTKNSKKVAIFTTPPTQ
jgi:hypothetical protein